MSTAGSSSKSPKPPRRRAAPLVASAAPAPPSPYQTPPPAGYQTSPYQTPPPSRSTRVLIGLAVTIPVLLIGNVILLTTSPWNSSDVPERWDDRVTMYADFVEQERRLDWEHPVKVNFMSDKDFLEYLNGPSDESEDEPSESEQKSLEAHAAYMRAIGFIEGDIDPVSESNTTNDASIVGFYSYDDQTIRIRGEELTPGVKITLVHELTHALQDQHFNLTDTLNRLSRNDEIAAETAFRSFVEGDATYIEGQWRESLTSEQQDELEEEESAQGEQIGNAISSVPEAILAEQYAPYILGPEVIGFVQEHKGGLSGVDDLLSNPPGEEALVDPWTTLDTEVYKEVTLPEEADYGRKDVEVFGATMLLIMLANRVDLAQTIAAVDGWGGDYAALYNKDDDQICVDIGFRGDTQTDTDEMRTAFDAWAAKSPDSAQVIPTDNSVVLVTCDPGVEATGSATGSPIDALGIVAHRAYIGQEMGNGAMEDITNSIGHNVAKCLATQLALANYEDPEADFEADPESCAT